VALVGLFAAARPAAAEAPRADASAAVKASEAELKNARHEELLKQGGKHYTAKRYHVAETILLEVWRENRTFEAAVNLGHVEYKLGKMPEAATYFSYALKNWPASEAQDLEKQEQRRVVEQRLAEVKAQLGTLTLRVNLPGAEIAIDGKRLEEALTGTEVFVMPGKHRIEAKLAGYEPAVTTTDVGRETSRVVALMLKPVEQRTIGSKNKALIVSGAAVSVAMVGAGVWLYVASASPLADKESLGKQIDSGRTKKDCVDDPNPLCAELSSAVAKSDQLRNWGTAALITGGVLGAGTLVYSLWPSSKPEARTGVRVIPVVSGSTGGIEVLGRF
jgi:tetratricopeptide (TPR) repeat protein